MAMLVYRRVLLVPFSTSCTSMSRRRLIEITSGNRPDIIAVQVHPMRRGKVELSRNWKSYMIVTNHDNDDNDNDNDCNDSVMIYLYLIYYRYHSSRITKSNQSLYACLQPKTVKLKGKTRPHMWSLELDSSVAASFKRFVDTKYIHTSLGTYNLPFSSCSISIHFIISNSIDSNSIIAITCS